jgi:hypothetical protein
MSGRQEGLVGCLRKEMRCQKRKSSGGMGIDVSLSMTTGVGLLHCVQMLIPLTLVIHKCPFRTMANAAAEEDV